jgi:hypothetical protein
MLIEMPYSSYSEQLSPSKTKFLKIYQLLPLAYFVFLQAFWLGTFDDKHFISVSGRKVNISRDGMNCQNSCLKAGTTTIGNNYSGVTNYKKVYHLAQKGVA